LWISSRPTTLANRPVCVSPTRRSRVFHSVKQTGREVQLNVISLVLLRTPVPHRGNSWDCSLRPCPANKYHRARWSRCECIEPLTTILRQDGFGSARKHMPLIATIQCPKGSAGAKESANVRPCAAGQTNGEPHAGTWSTKDRVVVRITCPAYAITGLLCDCCSFSVSHCNGAPIPGVDAGQGIINEWWHVGVGPGWRRVNPDQRPSVTIT
jgi:hypothetical protein